MLRGLVGFESVAGCVVIFGRFWDCSFQDFRVGCLWAFWGLLTVVLGFWGVAA